MDSESTLCRGSDFIDENDDNRSSIDSTIYRQPQLQPGNFKPSSEAECREALKEFVKGHLCYGSKPTKEFELLSRDAVNSFRYSLRTFSEVRSFHIKREPYKGGHVDGPGNTKPYDLWDLKCKPKKMFFEHEVCIEVPHTAKLEKCTCCHGSGLYTCKDCKGDGQYSCSSCNGRGYYESFDEATGYTKTENCHCYGGYASCYRCGGYGQFHCKHCEGYRYNKYYTQLTVRFYNHDDKRIVHDSCLPDDLLAKVDGTVLYQETNSRVQPITNFSVDEINQQSIDLIRSHVTERPNKRIHAQQQTLCRVPITEVIYRWRNRNYRFWVYGNERLVYAPDYPQRCCCPCILL